MRVFVLNRVRLYVGFCCGSSLQYIYLWTIKQALINSLIIKPLIYIILKKCRRVFLMEEYLQLLQQKVKDNQNSKSKDNNEIT